MNDGVTRCDICNRIVSDLGPLGVAEAAHVTIMFLPRLTGDEEEFSCVACAKCEKSIRAGIERVIENLRDNRLCHASGSRQIQLN